MHISARRSSSLLWAPWLVFCGTVFTDRVIVQRVTNRIWLDKGRAIDDGHAIRFARIFSALSTAVSPLRVFYESLPPSSDIQKSIIISLDA
jgi:hypothetical protein